MTDPTTGPAVVRHEERMRIGTEVVRTGRLRVRRRLVTEERTITVPVVREEIEVDYEEVPAGALVAEPGAVLSDEVHEIVLHEERVVVTTERVPVERVRLVRSVVPGAQVVDTPLRREVVGVQEEVVREPAGAVGPVGTVEPGGPRTP